MSRAKRFARTPETDPEAAPEVAPEVVKETAPEAAPEVAPEVAPKATVKVFAKIPPFLDLIKDVRIGADPVEVELHPWLCLNIKEGLLVVVEN